MMLAARLLLLGLGVCTKRKSLPLINHRMSVSSFRTGCRLLLIVSNQKIRKINERTATSDETRSLQQTLKNYNI